MTKIKFKILKETVVTKTNIFGKPIERETICYIYRPVFFGLFKLFLLFVAKWDDSNQAVMECWYVSYIPKKYASTYREKDAEKMLETIYSQPDKFIRKP